MDKQFYRTLLMLVNDTDKYGLLQSYVDKRIQRLQNTLETCTDLEEVRRLQGRIAELRRLQHLRDEVITEAKG
jgi:5-bromo-4-chloroindolyl phosphate hydrolysis protein